MGEDFWSAKSIANRYEFIKELGSGATGTVNLALDKTLDKQVAIKILKVNWTANQYVRFQQEARLSGKLKHSNIATVMDFGVTDGGQPYLIMEYVDGGSLASLIAEERTLPLSALLKLFIDICRGMEHSHGQGILHRDLKPENVIVETDENGALHAKIVDFGLAKMQDTDASITRTGAFLGSPLYAAPEQSQGTFDNRSDIYSMGCLMYHVIKGRPPFSGDTSLETSILHKTA